MRQAKPLSGTRFCGIIAGGMETAMTTLWCVIAGLVPAIHGASGSRTRFRGAVDCGVSSGGPKAGSRMTRVSRALLALAFTAQAAAAGELVSSANTAEGLASQNKYLEAIEEMSWAVSKLYQWSPLLIRKSLFVAGEPGGFGIYDERKDAVFKRSETLIIYAEPVGFGYSYDQGNYAIDLTLDFEVKDKSGKVVASQSNFGTLSWKSRAQLREIYAKITYDFSGIQPGDYDVTTTIRDKHSQKFGSFMLPFTLTN
jgi:hypothetical protein